MVTVSLSLLTVAIAKMRVFASTQNWPGLNGLKWLGVNRGAGHASSFLHPN